MSDAYNAQRRGARRKDPRGTMLSEARKRAARKNIEITITKEDFKVPEVCPLLGIPIFIGDGLHCANSPSLDRVDVTKGYVPGNVWVISYKANKMKNDATLEELRLFCANVTKLRL